MFSLDSQLFSTAACKLSARSSMTMFLSFVLSSAIFNPLPEPDEEEDVQFSDLENFDRRFELSNLDLSNDDDISYQTTVDDGRFELYSDILPGLCVPLDRLEDVVEFFPNFSDNTISLGKLDKKDLEGIEQVKRNKRMVRRGNGSTVRKCSHCETEATPQWRAGPKGPNTLCNACGVRYRSGRLVAEYRPAASPTFNILKHSNFHRKIVRKGEPRGEEKKDEQVS